ncbi:hypothetical protein EVAR_101287_1 [Eumeta japonica]|uniref:Uncharacterized protein n=1 Tax=Eumeta variegata TaxID=151549 RepID=A0A4C1SG42_EUMVA|nr:hypothetical protein EVAR_101287_1 [Eumeta japonica]
MSSPNDEVPAVAGRGRHGWFTADSFSQTVPERPSVAAWALVYPRVGTGRGSSRGWFVSRKIRKLFRSRGWSYRPTFRPIGIRPIIRNKFRAFRHPYSWPYAAGDNSRRRVSLLTHEVRRHSLVQCGTKHFPQPGCGWPALAHWHKQPVALPWISFLVRALYSDTGGHIQIIEYILGPRMGRTARTAIMVSRLCGKVCAQGCTGKPWPQRWAWISSTGKSVGMPRITAFSLRSSSRAYV